MFGFEGRVKKSRFAFINSHFSFANLADYSIFVALWAPVADVGALRQ